MRKSFAAVLVVASGMIAAMPATAGAQTSLHGFCVPAGVVNVAVFASCPSQTSLHGFCIYGPRHINIAVLADCR